MHEIEHFSIETEVKSTIKSSNSEAIQSKIVKNSTAEMSFNTDLTDFTGVQRNSDISGLAVTQDPSLDGSDASREKEADKENIHAEGSEHSLKPSLEISTAEGEPLSF